MFIISWNRARPNAQGIKNVESNKFVWKLKRISSKCYGNSQSDSSPKFDPRLTRLDAHGRETAECRLAPHWITRQFELEHLSACGAPLGLLSLLRQPYTQTKHMWTLRSLKTRGILFLVICYSRDWYLSSWVCFGKNCKKEVGRTQPAHPHWSLRPSSRARPSFFSACSTSQPRACSDWLISFIVCIDCCSSFRTGRPFRRSLASLWSWRS